MERPSWAKLTGLIIIIFGVIGAFNDIKQINTPRLLDLQDDIFGFLQDRIQDEKLDEEDLKVLKLITPDSLKDQLSEDMGHDAIFDTIKSISIIPPASMDRLVLLGYVGLVTSILMIIAGVCLLKFRKNIISFVFLALIISILIGLYQYFDLSNTELSIPLRTGLSFSLAFGIAIDSILLIVVSISDKTYFTQPNLKEDYYDSYDN